VALVADASALIVALLGATAPAETLRRRLDADICHAPHLVDAEIGHVLRRRVLRGEVPATTAEALLRRAESLVNHRYRMSGALAQAAWALRLNLTFYDALYAALAAALDCPLLTADGRLARAPGLPCAVELIAS
jgi:predicted nucleic acid-binding protein